MLFLHLLNSHCTLRWIKNMLGRQEAKKDEQKINDKNTATDIEEKKDNNRTNNEKELEKTQNGKEVAPKPPTDKKDEKKENPLVEKTAAAVEKK